MSDELRPGLIVRAQSGFFIAQTDAGLVTCQLRGRLKQGRRTGDIAAVGDRVTISLQSDGTGMIEEIRPRLHAIVRLDPRPRGVYQQVLLANPDQAIFVFSCAKPEPHMRMLDRFLVIASKQDIPAVIIANKIDLVDLWTARRMFGHYEPLGYQVIYSSAKQGQGLNELRDRLAGKISVLTGPSGVGKSSLLNAIQPGLGLAVSAISATRNKGQHTTNVRQLFPLEVGGYVADTPGWKSLALWDTEPEELDGYFPEIAPLVSKCQYNDCTHLNEPQCAVRAAVDDGKIHPDRYESYIRLRTGEA
ncbi:MAG: ribosome small subunit-dependent GTPase A [Anaerolineales bacterium]|nr:ribosome small subunit-dependent GTPase A [Anaerolineales bacterium]